MTCISTRCRRIYNRSIAAGRFEELSRSGRRFCPSPDQSAEACQFHHDEAEVMSNSRSAQSSPVKSSIGFWLSLLRSTSCLSPRTLSLLPQIGTTKPVVPPVIPIEDRGMAIPIEDRDRVIPERQRLCGVIVKGFPVSLAWFPLLEVRFMAGGLV
ncbi:hypothetical protein F2Q69_00029042 [Brassica cretica]|uniref:Uncharacterized protein n=1 Tax=Brassica cretica TaxID=69181 RepID=A0A8S9S8F9_BRACR|nr:hypothetical protein F2Q69_00029042 [Brassica cretica]